MNPKLQGAYAFPNELALSPGPTAGAGAGPRGRTPCWSRIPSWNQYLTPHSAIWDAGLLEPTEWPKGSQASGGVWREDS